MSRHLKKYVTPSGGIRWAVVVGETTVATFAKRQDAERHRL